MIDIVIATRNRHKFRELKALLRTRGVRWHSLMAFPAVHSIDETGRTFDANAINKALAVARATGYLALADDSGLEVDVLGGNPGVRSARFAGRHGDDRANNQKLLRLLNGLPSTKRRARYRCSLALASPRLQAITQGGRRGRSGERSRTTSPSHVVALTQGTWHGRIATRPAGHRGFGYDPLFLVPRYGKTVGQLAVATKQRLSHRARAARRMRPVLQRLASHARR